MPYLQKAQVQQLLDNAPPNLNRDSVLDGLIQRGYTLEGVDTALAKQQIKRKQEANRARIAGLFSRGEVADIVSQGQKSHNVQSQLPSTMSKLLGTNDGSFSARIKDIPSDIAEMGNNIADSFRERTDRLADNRVSGQNSLSTGYQSLAETVGFVADSAFEVATGAVKTVLTPTQEKMISKGFSYLGTSFEEHSRGSAGREAVSAVVAGWNNFAEEHPEAAANTIATGQIAEVLGDVFGLKLGTTASKEVMEAASSVIVKTTPVATQAASQAQDIISSATAKAGDGVRQSLKPSNPESKALDASGRVLQATDADKSVGLRALSSVDTSGVKSYKELNQRIDTTLADTKDGMDAYLSKFSETYDVQSLGKYEKVDGKTIITNPVTDALDELELHYDKTNNAADASRMQALRQKLENEGLTVLELNNLARRHGKDLNAYNANGELASGLKKQAVENTRSGLKEVSRQRLPDDTAKDMDAKMADLLSTQKLTQRVEKKVNELNQKLMKRSLGQKVGGTLFDIADMVAFGGLRGFIQKSGASNVGNKTANFMDIERQLEKNLKQIEKLLEISDNKAFEKAVVEFSDEVKSSQ